MDFALGRDGRSLGATFSVAESAESSGNVSGDSVEYSAGGVVDGSVAPIFSQNMPSFSSLLFFFLKD